MARTPTQRAASDKPISRRVLVNIHRDQTAVTPRVVWAHEIPILEVVFGEGNIKPVEAAALDDGFQPKATADMLPFNKKQDPVLPPSMTQGIGFAFIGDPRTEYQRLCDVYGRHPEVNEAFCEHVYGRFQSGKFAELVGSPSLADLPDEQIRDLLRGYGVEHERIKAAGAGETLIALAESAGVEIG